MPQLDFAYYGVTICWSVLKLLLFVCLFELLIIVFLGRSFRHNSFILFKNYLYNFSNNFEKKVYSCFSLISYIGNIKEYQNYFSTILIANFIRSYSYKKKIIKLIYYKIRFYSFLYLNIEKKKIVKNNLVLLLLLDLPYNGQMSFQDPATPIMEGIILFHHELLIIQIFIAIFVFWMLLRTVMLFRLKIFKLNKVMGNFLSSEYFIVQKDNMWDEKARFIPALCDWFRFICLIYFSRIIWNIEKNKLDYYKKLGFGIIFQTINYLCLNFFYGFLLYTLKYKIVTFFEFFKTKEEEQDSFNILQTYWFFTYLFYDLRHKNAYNQSLYYINYIDNFNEAFKINTERESLSSPDVLGYENRVPSKVRHHTLLESVWTIIPSLILIIIAIPSFALLYAMDELVAPAMTVHVMGNQWYWRYTYTLFRAQNFSYYFNNINSYGVNASQSYTDNNLEAIEKKLLFDLNFNKDLVVDCISSSSKLSLHFWPKHYQADCTYNSSHLDLDYKTTLFEYLFELQYRLFDYWYFSDAFFFLVECTLLGYLGDFDDTSERFSMYLYLLFLISYHSNKLNYEETKSMFYFYSFFISWVIGESLKVVLLYEYYLDKLLEEKRNSINNYALNEYLKMFFISDLTELLSLRFIYLLILINEGHFQSLVYPRGDFEKVYFNLIATKLFNLRFFKVSEGFTTEEYFLLRRYNSRTYKTDYYKGTVLLLDYYLNEVSLLTNFIGDFKNKTLNELYHFIILKSVYFSIYYPNMLFLNHKYSSNFTNTAIDLAFLKNSSYIFLHKNLLIAKYRINENLLINYFTFQIFVQNKLQNTCDNFLYYTFFNNCINNDILYIDFFRIFILNGNKFFNSPVLSDVVFNNVNNNNSQIFFNTIKSSLNGSFYLLFQKKYDLSFRSFSKFLKPWNFLTLCSFERDLKIGLKIFIKNSLIFAQKNNSSFNKFFNYYNFFLNYNVWNFSKNLYNIILPYHSEQNAVRFYQDDLVFGNCLDGATLLYKQYIKNMYFMNIPYSSAFSYLCFKGNTSLILPDQFSLGIIMKYFPGYSKFLNNIVNTYYYGELDLLKGWKSFLNFYSISYFFNIFHLRYYSFEALCSYWIECISGMSWFYNDVPFGCIMDILETKKFGEATKTTTEPLGKFYNYYINEKNSWLNILNKVFSEKLITDFNLKNSLISNEGHYALFDILSDKNSNLKTGLNNLYFLEKIEEKKYLYNWNFLSALIKKPIDFENYISRKGRITFESRLQGNLDSTYFILPNKLGMYRLLDVDNVLILPERISIRLLITSSDVLHSWSVPSLGIKLDACPGRLNQTSLYLKRIGTFYGQCSEICGINHAFMPIVVKSIPLTSYTYMRLICFNKIFLKLFKNFDLSLFNISKLMYTK